MNQLHPNSNTDLCAQTVKIRLSFMQEIANIAVGRSLRDLEGYLREAQGASFESKAISNVSGQGLLHAAKALTNASEFKRAVDALNERDTFILVRE